jgi:hypothetical protein
MESLVTVAEQKICVMTHKAVQALAARYDFAVADADAIEAVDSFLLDQLRTGLAVAALEADQRGKRTIERDGPEMAATRKRMRILQMENQ